LTVEDDEYGGREEMYMPHSWDYTMKRWVGEVPQDFISWLLRGAVVEEEVSAHLQSRQTDADLLYRVRINDRPYMFHVEFQSTSHPQMAERMVEYNIRATIEYKLPVHSFLIYLKKGAESDNAFVKSPFIVLSAFEEEIHHFSYKVIKMWEVPTDVLLNAGYKGLLPLVPLTADGENYEAVEQAIEQLMPEGEAPEAELLSLLYWVAGLRYTEDVKRSRLERRFGLMENIFQDSWSYQETQKKGIEQGIEQGIEKGRRQDILALVQKKFTPLLTLAQERVALLKTPEQLQKLLLMIAQASSEQEAQRYLLEVGEEQKH
jgi:predicted transposase YdaD